MYDRINALNFWPNLCHSRHKNMFLFGIPFEKFANILYAWISACNDGDANAMMVMQMLMVTMSAVDDVKNEGIFWSIL